MTKAALCLAQAVTGLLWHQLGITTNIGNHHTLFCGNLSCHVRCQLHCRHQTEPNPTTTAPGRITRNTSGGINIGAVTPLARAELITTSASRTASAIVLLGLRQGNTFIELYSRCTHSLNINTVLGPGTEHHCIKLMRNSFS